MSAMCGRFTIGMPPELIEEAFDASGRAALPETVLAARYNVAPTQDVLIVKRARPSEEKRRVLEAARWGLAGSAKMINARQETVFEKQPFSSAMKSRRCLVPADGFFEWKKLSGSGRNAVKQPLRIRMKDGSLFAMAGIFARWQNPAGEWVETCSVLTTTPNELVEPVHDRMPVILAPEDWDLWLDTSIKSREPLEHLFLPFPAAQMIAEPVSARVNNVDNDDASLIEVVAPIEMPNADPASVKASAKKAKQLGFEF